jgi:hypothetical protein
LAPCLGAFDKADTPANNTDAAAALRPFMVDVLTESFLSR